MAIEREIKLVAAPDFRLPALDGLVDGLSASEVETLKLSTVYYDTPDLRLTRWGCGLRLREGEGWTVKLPAPPGPLAGRRRRRPGRGGRRRGVGGSGAPGGQPIPRS